MGRACSGIVDYHTRWNISVPAAADFTEEERAQYGINDELTCP
jgi:hypothetical protein